jgi:hypothetical protein
MSKKVPWAARNIAGAKELKEYGYTYTEQKDVYNIISNFEESINYINTTFPNAYEYVCNTHSIANTVDDIELIINNNI